MSLSSDVNKLYELAYAHVSAKATHIAVDLKLDQLLLTRAALSISDIAKQLDFDEQGLTKLLLLLEAYDLLSIDDAGVVRPTAFTSLLRYLDSPHITLNYKTIDLFQDACKFNKEIFSEAYGKEFYPYLKQRKLLQRFRSWCTETAKLWLPSVLSIYDFSSIKSIADIGGGEGYLLGIILSKYRSLKATLLDQKDVIEGAASVLSGYEVQERVDTVAGDFFDICTLPKKHDAYILCRTLLNWSDEDAVTIINNCAKVMKAEGRVLIIDFFIPEKTRPDYKRALLSDAVLLATFKSANRTLNEWESLVRRTQLQVKGIYTSKVGAEPEPIMPFCVIELVKDL